MSVKYHRWIYLHLILLAVLGSSPAHAQFAFQVEITSPSPGDAVQGTVLIYGTSSVNGFAGYHMEFSLWNDINESWFNIVSSTLAIDNNVLAEWDTSTLTDGKYNLRLTVLREEDSPIIFLVNNLRIRNYTPIETATIGPTQTQVPGKILSPTSTSFPATPTNLPDNSLILSQKKIQTSIIIGASLAGSSLILFGVYAFYKSRTNNN